MPLYGRSFTLSSALNNGIGAPITGRGNPGQYIKESGILAYFEICSLIKNNGWIVVDGNGERGPYAYSGNQWVGYDDEKTIRTKVCINPCYSILSVMFA